MAIGGDRDDEGTTLIELVVGMTLMAIFGGLFTGVVVMMNRSTTKSQSVSLSTSQINQAFLTLDKSVRYATAISRPGQSTNLTIDPAATQTNDWYVELRTPIGGAMKCTQLRVHAEQLQSRTWDAATPDPLLPFRPVTSFIVNGKDGESTIQPFFLVDPAANVSYQQLTINLTARSKLGSSVTDSSSSVTFAALNSTLAADTICGQTMRT